jgi:hypothetical protein
MGAPEQTCRKHVEYAATPRCPGGQDVYPFQEPGAKREQRADEHANEDQRHQQPLTPVYAVFFDRPATPLNEGRQANERA